jgi:small multidrug resistance pump
MHASYLHLIVAIAAEVIATSCLKHSDGMTRLGPTLAVVIGYAVAFFFLSLALRTVPVGLAYAIWSGAGIVLVSLAGWLLFRQSIDAPGLIGIGLILTGVLVMNVFSKTSVH